MSQKFEVLINGAVESEYDSQEEANRVAEKLKASHEGKTVEVRPKLATTGAEQGTPGNPAGAKQG